MNLRLTLAMLLLACAMATMGGCAGAPNSPYAAADPGRRDSQRAESLSREAADLVGSDPERAERLLREALAADLFCGPAHNNLGVLFLESGRLYEAASEFEWARKLMPGHPDPRLNLGLVLERGGRVDEAIEAYRSALVVAPEHLPSVQALARCQIRHNRRDTGTVAHLEKIAMDADRDWRVWARDQLLAAHNEQH